MAFFFGAKPLPEPPQERKLELSAEQLMESRERLLVILEKLYPGLRGALNNIIALEKKAEEALTEQKFIELMDINNKIDDYESRLRGAMPAHIRLTWDTARNNLKLIENRLRLFQTK